MKKIQRIVLLAGLWIGWVGHHSAFGTAPYADPVQKKGFFDKNEQSILHLGIRSWAQWTKKVIQKHWAIGSEIVVGPVVEWHPLHGIGLQTGLLYSYNCFFTIDFSVDRKRLLDTCLFSFGRRLINEIKRLSAKHEGYIAHAGLGNIAFHAISLPLFLRLYPETSRKLVCYGGPRFILIYPGVRKKQYCPVHIDTSSIKNIFYDALQKGKHHADEYGISTDTIKKIAEQGLLKIYHSIFHVNADSAQNHSVAFWDVVWDFGLEFRSHSGVVIGINGLGVVLGYNFIRHPRHFVV